MRLLKRRDVCLFFYFLGTRSLLLAVLTNMAFAQGVRDELAGYNDPPSRLRGVIEKFGEDYGILNRFYSAQTSQNRSERFRQLYSDELAVLGGLNFDSLNHDEQVDYVLFKNYLDHEQKELGRYDAQLAEMAPLIPFARTISDLEDTRRTLKDLDPAKNGGFKRPWQSRSQRRKNRLTVGAEAETHRRQPCRSDGGQPAADA